MENFVKVHQNCNSELVIECTESVSKIIVEFENTRVKRVKIEQTSGNNGNTKD